MHRHISEQPGIVTSRTSRPAGSEPFDSRQTACRETVEARPLSVDICFVLISGRPYVIVRVDDSATFELYNLSGRK